MGNELSVGVLGEVLPPDTQFKTARDSELIGLFVEGFRISDGRQSMYINGTRDGKRELYQLEVWGDCCSHSWIEDVFEPNALIGHTILRVEDLDLDTPANQKPCIHCNENHMTIIDDMYDGTVKVTDQNSHDHLQYYGFAIYTEVGRFVIDFRNESNGYYGGSISASKAV